ncbi:MULTISPECIES: SWIM zinc finger family protein [Brevibacterium]|uniref:SWIM-type domain-containing protein n=1 Tax=Brevibacterium aurantiacum TaxID=273384 RepID=A0A368M0S5_BREAU|nr:hypothetical protein CXR26_11550 [Brevibacterium aurantiacum]AZL13434.1 hypothetical protein CXR25_11905 [Brevibacterium aurantiacum]AZT93946.1 hypothetical protein CXR23_12995 [Brevibacterium aurantiacum]AZT97746.1 hypothetical protein CXR27_12640 [Brevibacterium aurantiacum]RCS92503.1 hypothetical protein CIK61_16770 [Brevibacterium aurantiacum]
MPSVSKSFGSRFYPPSKPRTVDGGIRAKSKRGSMAQAWWSTRFITVLEGMGMGTRLTRGRNYARRGQVLDIDLDAGLVNATVQGSRARPYRVRIGLRAYGKAEWASIEERMNEDAWFVAQLLSGQMPADIEKLFDDVGLTLFPIKGELTLDCSCPDSAVPCKHVAAVVYLLAEQFDEDPFRILAWRGREREDLLEHLHTGSTAENSAPVPLTELLDAFYFQPAQIVPPRPLGTAVSVLEQVPPIDVTVRKQPLAEVLRPAYEALAEDG